MDMDYDNLRLWPSIPLFIDVERIIDDVLTSTSVPRLSILERLTYPQTHSWLNQSFFSTERGVQERARRDGETMTKGI